MRSPSITALMIFLWASSLLCGFGFWMNHDSIAGSIPSAIADEQAVKTEGSKRFQLWLFAHPYCPCTRATLQELSRTLVDCSEVDVHIQLFRPKDDVSPERPSGTAWEQIRQVPGVQVDWDEEGREAKRHGAVTSGHLLLFHPDGSLLFSGGITRARGYTGGNVAEQALRARLKGETTEYISFPVYGCPIVD